MSVTRSETGAQHALGHPGTLGRAATPARTESTPKKWSARRFLMFVIVSCSVLWALIIAAAVQLWTLLS
jgi:hypothetical protein